MTLRSPASVGATGVASIVALCHLLHIVGASYPGGEKKEAEPV